MTYLNTLTLIENEANTAIQLDLISTLSSYLGENENPPYQRGLQVIASIDDQTNKDELTVEIYTLNVTPDSNTAEPFDYIERDYVTPNPGIRNNAYSAYVGVYYNDIGEET